MTRQAVLTKTDGIGVVAEQHAADEVELRAGAGEPVVVEPKFVQ